MGRKKLAYIQLMVNERQTPGAQSMRRSLQVLKVLSANHDSGMSANEVIEASGLERSTAHRMLTCLVEEGFADRDDSRRYRLGLEAMKLGFATMTRAPIVTSYEGLMRGIAQATGDTVFLMLRQGDYTVCLRREEGLDQENVFFSTRVGDIRPLGIGVGGMALLAAAGVEAITRIRVQHAQAFEAAGLPEGIIGRVIARTRRMGYAEMLDTVTQGVAGVAAVIPVTGGTPFAAITIATSSAQMPAERRAELGQFLIETLRQHG